MTKRILIADDELATRTTIKRVLTINGYKILLAADGKEAMDIIMEMENSLTPLHLLITDIRMPLMSGIELIDRLSEKEISIPTLVMTGNSNDIPQDKIKSGKIKNYIEKPFEFSELIEVVNKIFVENPDNHKK